MCACVERAQSGDGKAGEEARAGVKWTPWAAARAAEPATAALETPLMTKLANFDQLEPLRLAGRGHRPRCRITRAARSAASSAGF